eukprot:SAG31_NODE_29994_length_386_cov_4.498258_1_plen_31_part_10
MVRRLHTNLLELAPAYHAPPPRALVLSTILE